MTVDPLQGVQGHAHQPTSGSRSTPRKPCLDFNQTSLLGGSRHNAPLRCQFHGHSPPAPVSWLNIRTSQDIGAKTPSISSMKTSCPFRRQQLTQPPKTPLMGTPSVLYVQAVPRACPIVVLTMISSRLQLASKHTEQLISRTPYPRQLLKIQPPTRSWPLSDRPYPES